MGRGSLPGFQPPKGGAYAAKAVRPFRVPTDPPVGDDGPCVVTGCGRPRTPVARLHGDPFCSRPCCERWYLGVALSDNQQHARAS